MAGGGWGWMRGGIVAGAEEDSRGGLYLALYTPPVTKAFIVGEREIREGS